MSHTICNLVFEGGGVKGLAYLGALEELQKYVILPKVENIAGTSIGAIFALLLGLNYNISEIKAIAQQINLKKFINEKWTSIDGIFRLIRRYGFYRETYLREWLENIVVEKTHNKKATFADIYSLKAQHSFRNMYFVATNLTKGCCEFFSYEHSPHMELVEAVLCSAAIPLIFPAVKIKPLNMAYRYNQIFVDGGVINNYPIRIFDRKKYLKNFNASDEYANLLSNDYIYNPQTLGLRLEDKNKIQLLKDHIPTHNKCINNFYSYLLALTDILITSQQDLSHLESKDNARTIYIDTFHITSTNFNLKNKEINLLIESGRKAVSQYFNPNNNQLNDFSEEQGNYELHTKHPQYHFPYIQLLTLLAVLGLSIPLCEICSLYVNGLIDNLVQMSGV